MDSVLWVIVIIYGIFWGIYLKRRQEAIPDYSRWEIALFFGISRLVPGIMNWQWNLQMWKNAVAELAGMLLLLWYVRRYKEEKIRSNLYAVYLVCPGMILAILYGEFREILVLLVFWGVVLAADWFVNKQGGSLASFLPEYLTANVGIFLWFVSTGLYGQTLDNIMNTEQIPTLLVLSGMLLLCAVISCTYRFFAGVYLTETSLKTQKKETAEYGMTEYNIKMDEVETGKQCSCHSDNRESLRGKDILIMGFLTVCFAVIVLLGLGSRQAPETYEILRQGTQNEKQIILEFEEETELSKVSIFLGYAGKRVVSISYLGEGEDWNLLLGEQTIESAFCWNEVQINQKLRGLCIDLLEGEAYLHEIVCLDGEGKCVLPVNSGEYEKLFDEQELFPENATYFYRSMFDEVYHARTAYEFLNRLPIYETTHPPLGKTMISLGIRVFGWRIVCALCGILMMPLMYLFAHRMFKKTESAAFSTLLLATEFMHFTLSRIATLDVIVGFLILLMFFTMYGFIQNYHLKENIGKSSIWLAACGLATALAVSVKWTGFYAAAGIAVLFFSAVILQLLEKKEAEDITTNSIKTVIFEHRKNLGKLFFLCILFFCLLPFTIYTLSYLPFAEIYQDKGLLQNMIENTKLMFTYHKDCVFEHPYSSMWYEWLWDKQPLLDSYTVLDEKNISVVATFGNPLILWGGLVALIHQFYLWRIKKCRDAGYLIVAYAAMMMPWFFVHRTVFIYHYFPGIVILILMIANSLSHIRKGRKCRIIFSMGTVILFVMFYPVLSGKEVSIDYVNQVLEWMVTWKLAL